MFHFVCIPNRNFLSAPGRSGNSAFTISDLDLPMSGVLPDEDGKWVETENTHRI